MVTWGGRPRRLMPHGESAARGGREGAVLKPRLCCRLRWLWYASRSTGVAHNTPSCPRGPSQVRRDRVVKSLGTQPRRLQRGLAGPRETSAEPRAAQVAITADISTRHTCRSRWLCRRETPPGGTVICQFAGREGSPGLICCQHPRLWLAIPVTWHRRNGRSSWRKTTTAHAHDHPRFGSNLWATGEDRLVKWHRIVKRYPPTQFQQSCLSLRHVF